MTSAQHQSHSSDAKAAIAAHPAIDNDKVDGESFAEALAKLTPEQTEMFMQALEMTMAKRRYMLLGNLLALLFCLVGMILAFIVYINRDPGQFLGWVFLIPVALAAGTLWVFGALARKAGTQSKSEITASDLSKT